jgi:hypothetical protein
MKKAFLFLFAFINFSVFSYELPFMIGFGVDSASFVFTIDKDYPENKPFQFSGSGAYFAYAGPRIIDQLFLIGGYRGYGSFDSNALYTNTFQSFEVGILNRDPVYASVTVSLITVSRLTVGEVTINTARSIGESIYLGAKLGFSKKMEYYNSPPMFLSGGLSVDYLSYDRFSGWYPGLFIVMSM